ncbi:hypothetical protein VCV18_010151 [Metarhizium anisopliae]
MQSLHQKEVLTSTASTEMKELARVVEIVEGRNSGKYDDEEKAPKLNARKGIKKENKGHQITGSKIANADAPVLMLVKKLPFFSGKVLRRVNERGAGRRDCGG